MKNKVIDVVWFEDDGTFSEYFSLAGSAGGKAESLDCCQSYVLVTGHNVRRSMQSCVVCNAVQF